jgi:hypothetical protein
LSDSTTNGAERELALEEIAVDPDVQDRAEVSGDVIADYAAADLSAFPPVRVWDDGSRLLLSAGHHTLEANRKAGRDKIRALVFTGSKADAILDSVRSNTRHGKRRTGADKRRAVTLLLKTYPEWADNLIADEAQVDNELVANVRQEIYPPAQPAEPQVAHPKGKGGKRKGKDKKKRPASKEGSAEQRQLIRKLIAADPDRSSRDIAGEVGCSPRTVDKEKKAVEREANRKPEVNGQPMCSRCQRVGPVKDCSKCAEVRKGNKSLAEQVNSDLAKEPEDDKPQTIDEAIKQKNGEIESFCRKLMKLAEEEMPEDPWLAFNNRSGSALQKIKDACSTLRSAKCHCACPMCQGAGCKQCHGTGRVTKYAYDQLAG